MKNRSSWICCQLGAREHYIIPRALHKAGELVSFITDAWVLPSSSREYLPPFLKNIRGRFHADLEAISVKSFTNSLIQFEITKAIQRISGWKLTMARNLWFQKQALAALDSDLHEKKMLELPQPVFFAYSYAALQLFHFAKNRGWRTVLGQIDPGPAEEAIVASEYAKQQDYNKYWKPAPEEYWKLWMEECVLADEIIVNSEWSRRALVDSGVNPDKLRVIPLAYTPSTEAKDFIRTYPTVFTAERPLRVLFLGQVILRKGIIPLLQAADILRSEPVEFYLVGPADKMIEDQIRVRKNIQWHGSVSRDSTAEFYKTCDIFVLPTFSDGFAITQLEAKAWKMPIIASKFCGNVVQDGVTGSILSEINGATIAETILLYLRDSQKLRDFSSSCGNSLEFGLETLQNNLSRCAYAPIS